MRFLLCCFDRDRRIIGTVSAVALTRIYISDRELVVLGIAALDPAPIVR